MKKYAIVLFLILMLFFLLPIHSYQSFDDNFYINTQTNEYYNDVAWCKPCGELGSTSEYWEQDAGCKLEGDEVVIYYYNESILLDDENNVYEHVYDTLTKSYLYEKIDDKDDITLFRSTIDMRNVPQYLACVSHDNEVVCIGGRNLDKIIEYAKSITF